MSKFSLRKNGNRHSVETDTNDLLTNNTPDVHIQNRIGLVHEELKSKKRERHV